MLMNNKLEQKQKTTYHIIGICWFDIFFLKIYDKQCGKWQYLFLLSNWTVFVLFQTIYERLRKIINKHLIKKNVEFWFNALWSISDVNIRHTSIKHFDDNGDFGRDSWALPNPLLSQVEFYHIMIVYFKWFQKNKPEILTQTKVWFWTCQFPHFSWKKNILWSIEQSFMLSYRLEAFKFFFINNSNYL
jgi:hypothetical protein